MRAAQYRSLWPSLGKAYGQVVEIFRLYSDIEKISYRTKKRLIPEQPIFMLLFFHVSNVRNLKINNASLTGYVHSKLLLTLCQM